MKTSYIIYFHSLLLQSVFSDSRIFESRVTKICSYSLNRTRASGLNFEGCLLNGLSYAVAVTMDTRDNLLFYSDIVNLEIRSYNTETAPSGPGDRILYGFGSVEDMAVDWVAKNLYTADQSYRQIAVSRYDGTQRAVLIQEDVGKPRSIALHPREGLMFWADYGGLASIERANLDGTDVTTIVDANIMFPNGLAIDLTNNRVYFADRGSDNIASVNLDGGERVLIHYAFAGDFFDMVLVQEYLFVTSWTLNEAKGHITTVRNVSLDTREVEFEVIDHDGYGLGIASDSLVEQPDISSPCGTNNGGCDQLCFPLKDGEHVCGCSSGFTANGVTCETSPFEDDFVLVADSAQGKIFQVPIQGDGDYDIGDTVPSLQALPLDDLQYPVGLTYDPVEKHVYWTDLTTGSISKAALDGSFRQAIIYDNNVHVGIAIDTERRRVYWTDEDRNVIEVANLDGSGRQIIVQTNLNEPRGIVVDILTGDIYWTDWGSTPKIENASGSGSNREVVVTDNLSLPNGIAIDPEARILYWCDSSPPDQSKIEQLDLRTNTRSLLATLPSPSRPFGITLYNEFVYWSDWVKNAPYRLDRFSSNPVAEEAGEGVMLGMQGIASSTQFGIVTTVAPPATDPVSPVSSGEVNNLIVPIAAGVGGLVFMIVIGAVVGAVCARTARQRKENRRLESNSHGNRQSNDYRSRPEKSVDGPPLPDGHPSGDPLYMDLDEIRQEPPPPYTELNLQQVNKSSSSHQNPAFESGAGPSDSAALYDVPDGMAPPPPGVSKEAMEAGGGYMPYLKNNAQHECEYMAPDYPTASADNPDDSFYEIANNA